MRLRLPGILVLSLLFLICTLVPLHSRAQQVAFAPVQGQIFDSRTGRPAPGLMVSLVHPVLGRSAPAFTNGYGQFGWNAIPVRSEAYYLEVYWGQNVIYRQPLQVYGPVMLPPIRL